MNFNKSCVFIEEFKDYEIIDVSYWAMYELGVPIPAEEKVMKEVYQKLCNNFSNEAKFILFNLLKPKGDYKQLNCN
jgi:hypothetical protein